MVNSEPTPSPLGHIAKWIAGCVIAYYAMLWLSSEVLIWLLTHIHP